MDKICEICKSVGTTYTMLDKSYENIIELGIQLCGKCYNELPKMIFVTNIISKENQWIKYVDYDETIYIVN